MRWYAVRTNPKCEDRALSSIAAEGFEAYAPKARKHIVHHRTRVLTPKVYPMLVGYALVSLPSAAHASHIRGCDGVKAVLGVNGVPLPLPTREFEAIRSAEARMDELFLRRERELLRKDHNFKPGDRVHFSRGAWKGFEATVMDGRSKRAISVMMQVFGGMTEVEAPVDYFEAAA